jgi:hypothetical protein
MRLTLFFYLINCSISLSQNEITKADSLTQLIETLETQKPVHFIHPDSIFWKQEAISPHFFEKENYQKEIADFDYSERVKKPEKKANNYNFKLPDKKSYLGITQVILIIIVALFLIIIIILIIKQNKKSNREIEIDNWNIVDLDKTDKPLEIIEQKLNEAINNKDFNLAIRLYYLKVIAKLYFNKWIEWKKDKTNATYLYELSSTIYFEAFSQITLHFEYTWFGKRKIEISVFNIIIDDFKRFELTIKAKENDGASLI